MPQHQLSRDKKGVVEQKTFVNVKCTGKPFHWIVQTYAAVGDDRLFIFEAEGESMPMEAEYARRIFGDWTIDKNTPDGLNEWAEMLQRLSRRWPNGRIPSVEVSDIKTGEVLWNSENEMDEWVEAHGRKLMPGFIKGKLPVNLPEAPKVKYLEDMSRPQLDDMSEKVFGKKFPVGWTNESIKKALNPYVKPEMIREELEKTKGILANE